MFKTGLKRGIEEDEIYEITNSLRSDYNTDIFAKEWELELKKKNPSILHVMFKVHGFKLIAFGMLYTIGEILST